MTNNNLIGTDYLVHRPSMRIRDIYNIEQMFGFVKREFLAVKVNPFNRERTVPIAKEILRQRYLEETLV